MTAATTTAEAPRAKKKTRRYPFLPGSAQGGAFMVWLKRLHGWIGMWGAIVGIVIGITGITLNHRGAVNASSANDVARYELQIPEGLSGQAEFEAYVKQAMGFTSSALEPGGGGARGGSPDALRVRFDSTRKRYEISWLPGNQYASVVETTSGAISTMNSLHLGNRSGWIWVLVLDAFAGSLIFTSITGILLWSKGNGSALLAMVLFFSFLSSAFYFAAVI